MRGAGDRRRPFTPEPAPRRGSRARAGRRRLHPARSRPPQSRQRGRRAQPALGAVLEPDVAAVAVHDAARDGEPEPAPSALAAARRFEPGEGREHPLQNRPRGSPAPRPRRRRGPSHPRARHAPPPVRRRRPRSPAGCAPSGGARRRTASGSSSTRASVRDSSGAGNRPREGLLRGVIIVSAASLAASGANRRVWRSAAPASQAADGAEAVLRCGECGPLAQAAAGAMRAARRSACGGSGAAQAASGACHYPAGGGGRNWGERVVTGAKCGLRASGGKGIAKKIAREALVTAWYGAATTGLPPAAWSADADVGAERRNQVPYRDPSRCRAGRRPAPGTTGHSEAEAGSLKPNGEAAAVRDLTDRCGDRGTPRIDDASEPWRVALQAGPGALSGRADEAQRWQARRAETVLAATAGRPARRSRRLGRQRKASHGHSRSTAAAPPVSRSEAADRPSALSYPTPAPGLRDADPGRG